MIKFKRFACLLLALVLLFTWPGFLPQEAHAVAAVDDAALAVGLLFTTLAGVTFATSSGAVEATRNYITSKAEVASSLAGVITQGLLVNGTKLLLTRDVKSAYEGFVSGITDFYRTKPGYSEGSFAGSLPANVPVPITDEPISLPTNPSFATRDNPMVISLSSDSWVECYLTENHLMANIYDSTGFKKGVFGLAISGYHELVSYSLYVSGSNLYFTVVRKFYGDLLPPDVGVIPLDSGVTPTVKVSTDKGFSFTKSTEFDGSQALNTFASATDLPNTAYGDERDRSIDIGGVSNVIAGGLAGSNAAPGLSPAELLDLLKKAMYIPGTGAEVLPTEVPDVTEGTEPTEDPDKDPDKDPGYWLWPGLEIMFTELKENAAT